MWLIHAANRLFVIIHTHSVTLACRYATATEDFEDSPDDTALAMIIAIMRGDFMHEIMDGCMVEDA